MNGAACSAVAWKRNTILDDVIRLTEDTPCSRKPTEDLQEENILN